MDFLSAVEVGFNVDCFEAATATLVSFLATAAGDLLEVSFFVVSFEAAVITTSFLFSSIFLGTAADFSSFVDFGAVEVSFCVILADTFGCCF